MTLRQTKWPWTCAKQSEKNWLRRSRDSISLEAHVWLAWIWWFTYYRLSLRVPLLHGIQYHIKHKYGWVLVGFGMKYKIIQSGVKLTHKPQNGLHFEWHDIASFNWIAFLLQDLCKIQGQFQVGGKFPEILTSAIITNVLVFCFCRQMWF